MLLEQVQDGDDDAADDQSGRLESAEAAVEGGQDRHRLFEGRQKQPELGDVSRERLLAHAKSGLGGVGCPSLPMRLIQRDL